MASQSFADLCERLTDIDQLLLAHSALTQFKKAEAAANRAGGGLKNLASAVDALVTTPGRGRPAEVGALNRSAFVLLCSHFQGYVEDVHREAAQHTLRGKAKSVDAVIKLVTPRNANPHADIIERMFSGIGIYDVMAAPHWQKCSNANVRKRLTAYIEERNKIAHGKQLTIHKAKVVELKKFVTLLTRALDGTVAEGVAKVTGKKPW